MLCLILSSQADIYWREYFVGIFLMNIIICKMSFVHFEEMMMSHKQYYSTLPHFCFHTNNQTLMVSVLGINATVEFVAPSLTPSHSNHLALPFGWFGVDFLAAHISY